MKKIIKKIQGQEYEFLKSNPHLGNNIILLGLGGSHAYGTNIEGSDLDVRGVALNTKNEILCGEDFEQVTDNATDTVVYSLKKILNLLSNCNPNTIEMLGLKPEHYIYLSPIGKELVDNRKIFLSKKAISSFGGYATSQLRRLDNKTARLVGQAEREKHVLNSINNARTSFKGKYFEHSDDSIKLYVDDAIQPDYDKEIFMDINLHHYPLRDYKSMWNEMNDIVRDYAKIGKRNKNAIEHNKIAKHMMHLVRLYLMCLDILEHGEIITYREKDHSFLMDIRNGKYLDDNRQPLPVFFEMINDFEKKLEYAKNNTSLPEIPDYNAIKEFLISVNERIVKGELN